jgi:hypothetical protein
MCCTVLYCAAHTYIVNVTTAKSVQWPGYGINDPGYYSRQGKKSFYSPKGADRLWADPVLYPYSMDTGFFYPPPPSRVMRPNVKYDHSNPFTSTHLHSPIPTSIHLQSRPFIPIHLNSPPLTSTYLHSPPFTSTYLHSPPITSIHLHSTPFTSIHLHSPPFTSTQRLG